MARSLEIVRFHGDELEVVELDGVGWVALPTLLLPFGKRVDNSLGLLDGWARTRVERLTSRKGVENPLGFDVTLIHVDDAPLAIARLDRRGMDDMTKARHGLYLRECAKVLADYFTRGSALNPRAAAPIDPTVLALLQGQQRLAEALAAGVASAGATAKEAGTAAKEAAAGAARAEKKADRATEIAEKAARDAAHAAMLAGSRGVLDTLAAGVEPGRAAETPDGAVSRKPKDGYKSMRAVARDYALPRSGEGANVVSKIAEAVGIFEDATLFHVQDVVIGGRVKNEHRTYAPRALELLDKPLRTAHAVMVGLGYTVTTGGAMVALRTGTRSRAWVIQQMRDAAIAPATSADPQQSMPFERAS